MFVFGSPGIAEGDAGPLSADDRVVPDFIQVFSLAMQIDCIKPTAGDHVIRDEIIVCGELKQDGMPQMSAVKKVADDDIMPGIVGSVRIVLFRNPFDNNAVPLAPGDPRQ